MPISSCWAAAEEVVNPCSTIPEAEAVLAGWPLEANTEYRREARRSSWDRQEQEDIHSLILRTEEIPRHSDSRPMAEVMVRS